MRIEAAPLPLKAPTAADPARIDRVARDMEGLFAQMMIRAMREATPGDASFPGAAGKFRDLHDQKLAQALTQGRGLGIADMVARQLQREQAPASLPALPPGAAPAALPLHAPATPKTLHPAWIPLQAVPRFDPALERRPASVPAPAAVPAPASAPPVASLRSEGEGASPAEIRAFVARAWPHAERVAHELGVDPRGVLAQAALETGWGRSSIRAHGESAHNYFGIKAGRHWQGETVQTRTLEYVGGGFRAEPARFRAYPDMAASFDDYAALLRRLPRYGDVLGNGSDIRGFAEALQRAGYATDPDYARKIEAIATGPALAHALQGLGLDATRGPAAGAATVFAAGFGGL
mgnify:CR=1 FL=1|jgi:flagellar protein FlgJ